MLRMRNLLLPSILMAVLSVTASAQEPEHAATDSILMKMRSALRAVSSAQEVHYSKVGTYSDSLQVLKQYPTCVVNPEVRVKFLAAGPNGWAAEATHPALPGKSCVYWIGARDFLVHPKTAAEKRETDKRPGRAVCDLDPS